MTLSAYNERLAYTEVLIELLEELANLYSVKIRYDVFPDEEVFGAAKPLSQEHERFQSSLANEFALRGAKAYSADRDAVILRLVGIIFSADTAIRKHEVDVLLENFVALLAQIAGEYRDTSELWKRCNAKLGKFFV